MIAVYAIMGAVLILSYWALILWVGAKFDQKHLNHEHAERVFNEEKTNG